MAMAMAMAMAMGEYCKYIRSIHRAAILRTQYSVRSTMC